jgi:hypothetical protein
LVFGSSPGESTLSRTAAPINVSKPAVSRMPNTTSTPPSHGGISRSAVASAITGMIAVPGPEGPSTSTAIWYDEAVMNQISAAYSVGSPGTGAAGSGGGAPFNPTFHWPARTPTR